MDFFTDMEIEAILNDPGASISQVMKAVSAGERGSRAARSVRVGISSSSVVSLLGVFLRRFGLLNNVKVDVVQGNFDDPFSDVKMFANTSVDYMVLLPFFDTLMPAFEAQLRYLPEPLIAAKAEEIKTRYRIVLEESSGLSMVFVGFFHRIFPASTSSPDVVEEWIGRLNEVLRDLAVDFPNVKLVDLSALIGDVGRAAAFDLRFYFRNKAPYSPKLLNRLARQISDLSRGFGTYYFKALVLDCDNTLWGGVIGEDLLTGIKLGPHDCPGNIFWRVQHELADLERSGMLLCLCSKNNAPDVDEVFARHPEMVLKKEQIVTKRVNWSPKPENITDIAKELSIGLDSLIFLDDSEFEIEAVKTQLPSVRTFLVPKSLPEYPTLVADIRSLYLGSGVSKESVSKTTQYVARAQAESLKKSEASHEEYLLSLGLKVMVHRNDLTNIPRISELSQKSNQFNLTSVRYSEIDIRLAMSDDFSEVFSLSVADQFGPAGLTGVAVMRYEGETARVEAFLMSCRVIGRGIEFAIWPTLYQRARGLGCTAVTAEFRATAKNGQVWNFYDKLGMKCVQVADGTKSYVAELNSIVVKAPDWIEVQYVG
jgi:FkbH-like protein